MRKAYKRSDLQKLERDKFYAEAVKDTTIALTDPSLAFLFDFDQRHRNSSYAVVGRKPQKQIAPIMSFPSDPLLRKVQAYAQVRGGGGEVLQPSLAQRRRRVHRSARWNKPIMLSWPHSERVGITGGGGGGAITGFPPELLAK